jgi:uncharacterized protein (TIGR03437 family)
VPDPAGSDFVLRSASNGSRLLTSRFFRYVSSGDLLLDDAGGILLTGISPAGQNTSSDALQRGACGAQSPFLWRLDDSGNVRLATYFPAETAFEKGSAALGPGGSLMVISPRRIQRIALDQPTPMSVGCVLSAGYLLDLGRFSPGQIVTLIGARMGPETGVTAQPENGRFPKSLAGVRVLISNIPAPLLYVQAGQINTIVPNALPPGTEAEVVIEYNGRRTAPLRASVLGSDFSVFTASMSGHGQAAALNQDGTINSAGNPARAGSIVVLYGTGGGVTDPPSEDGAIAPLAFIPRPVVPIRVLIQYYGFAEVLYAGPAPGLVNGVFQINFRLPDTIPPQITQLAVGVATPHAPAPALAATIAVR